MLPPASVQVKANTIKTDILLGVLCSHYYLQAQPVTLPNWSEKELAWALQSVAEEWSPAWSHGAPYLKCSRQVKCFNWKLQEKKKKTLLICYVRKAVWGRNEKQRWTFNCLGPVFPQAHPPGFLENCVYCCSKGSQQCGRYFKVCNWVDPYILCPRVDGRKIWQSGLHGDIIKLYLQISVERSWHIKSYNGRRIRLGFCPAESLLWASDRRAGHQRIPRALLFRMQIFFRLS